HDERRYQPALDTHKISVGMVIDRIDAQGTEQFLQTPTKEMRSFWKRYLQIKKTHQSFEQILINEI
ncbi:MAG: hypothetical protein II540_04145, partial [Paludibacteraceae bacterium]|nr:hypothetical protein [Paludibacteraceae bacterium]